MSRFDPDDKWLAIPPAEQPRALPGAKTVPEAVEIWAAWWEDRQMKRARL
jgi:hypothetical protein